jgi:large subunit ribosomal protein L30
VAARRTAKRSGPMIKVTWARSTIGHTAAARGTIRALGLHRLNQTVEVVDTPETRGMLRRVAFLLHVQEPTGRGATSDEDSK